MWTAPGKTWLSVRTVKPLERVVTLYSGAWSTASNGLWLYKHDWLSNSIEINFEFSWRVNLQLKCSIEFSYLKRSGGIVLSDGVCSSVFVNNVQHPGQDSRVRSEFSSLHKYRVRTSAEYDTDGVWLSEVSTYNKRLEVLALWFEGLAQHLSFWIIILITKSNLLPSFLTFSYI